MKTESGQRPSVEEAVAYLLKCQTRLYRSACLHEWRQKYGDAFADAVEAQVRVKWNKSN